ncbi:reverse transcriptase domain-containing protein, partial [Tanacetum coccineum]
MSASMEARIAEYAAAPTPPLPASSLPLPLPSPLTASFTDAGAPLVYRVVGIRMSSLLLSTSHRTNIPKDEMPPQKRACFTTPILEHESGRVRQLDEIVKAMLKIELATLEGVNQKVTELATNVRQSTEEFQTQLTTTLGHIKTLEARDPEPQDKWKRIFKKRNKKKAKSKQIQAWSGKGKCMRTRSKARRLRQQQQQQVPPNLVEPPKDTMADNRTMAELLQAPTEGYEDAIVVPEIEAANFEIKHGLLTLVQNKQFFGHDKEDPHAHIRYFNKITSTLRYPNVPTTSIKLMLFPFSLEGAARIWLEKEPPRSIQTWDDLVAKFINQFFPPSKTTNLRNEITNFKQRFDESFSEAWDRFKDLLRACPHHGFSELHQLDTFYNALNVNDQDSLNSAAGGNFLDKRPADCSSIIESKSKVRNSRSKAIVAKVSTSASTSGVSPDVAELKDMVRALLLDKQTSPVPIPAPAPVKAVEQSCVTCGGAHSYRNCPATDSNNYRDNIQEYVSQAAAANFNQGNSGYRPPPMANQIRPPGFPPMQHNSQTNNQNRWNQNQNRGNGYNQGQIQRPQVQQQAPMYQPPVNQHPAYQAPAHQASGVSKTDFESYVKANDAVMQNMQNQMSNITDLLTKILTLLIPGPKSPGKDIDVYLRPLIEDLRKRKPNLGGVKAGRKTRERTRNQVLKDAVAANKGRPIEIGFEDRADNTVVRMVAMTR